jgi:hypothetical protein
MNDKIVRDSLEKYGLHIFSFMKPKFTACTVALLSNDALRTLLTQAHHLPEIYQEANQNDNKDDGALFRLIKNCTPAIRLEYLGIIDEGIDTALGEEKALPNRSNPNYLVEPVASNKVEQLFRELEWIFKKSNFGLHHLENTPTSVDQNFTISRERWPIDTRLHLINQSISQVQKFFLFDPEDYSIHAVHATCVDTVDVVFWLDYVYRNTDQPDLKSCLHKHIVEPFDGQGFVSQFKEYKSRSLAQLQLKGQLIVDGLSLLYEGYRPNELGGWLCATYGIHREVQPIDLENIPKILSMEQSLPDLVAQLISMAEASRREGLLSLEDFIEDRMDLSAVFFPDFGRYHSYQETNDGRFFRYWMKEVELKYAFLEWMIDIVGVTVSQQRPLNEL